MMKGELMNKSLIVAAIVATVSLGACSSTGQLTGIAALVVQDAQNVCHAFINDASGAVETLIQSYPAGTPALVIADNVCAAIDAVQVTPGATRVPGASSVTVNGVVIPYVR
jgi:hypothetical protein